MTFIFCWFFPTFLSSVRRMPPIVGWDTFFEPLIFLLQSHSRQVLSPILHSAFHHQFLFKYLFFHHARFLTRRITTIICATDCFFRMTHLLSVVVWHICFTGLPLCSTMATFLVSLFPPYQILTRRIPTMDAISKIFFPNHSFSSISIFIIVFFYRTCTLLLNIDSFRYLRSHYTRCQPEGSPPGVP